MTTLRQVSPGNSPSFGMLAGTAFGLAMANGCGIGVAEAQTVPPNGTPPADGAPMQLPGLSVQGSQGNGGYQVRMPALDKLNAPLVDTPQSIIEVPRQLLDDQGVTTMRDALRTVPGVSLAAGEGGQQGDNLSIRGFNAQNDFYLDGMRDFGSYYRDPFNLDRLEVLEGPSSVLFGRGSSGGVVNQVSKQPQLAPVTQGSITLGTDQLYRFTSDVNRAITGLDGAAVRLNVMGNTNGVPGRDNAAWRRFGFAPELAFGLGTNTRFTLDYYHLQSYDTPDYGIPWLNGRPAPVGHNTFYGYADSDYFRTNVDIATAKLEHDFSDNLTVTDQLRYGAYGRALRVSEPLILGQGPGQDFIKAGLPLSSVLVSRHDIALKSQETNLDEELYGTWRAGTGFLHNVLTTGIEASRQTSTPTRFTYPYTIASLLGPDSSTPFVLNPTVSTIASVNVTDLGLFGVDTLSLGEHFDIITGWRWDRFDSTYRQSVAPVANLKRDDDLPTYRAAVVYKPTSYGSLYADYATSFDPSAESLGLTAATATVAPEKTTTYEVGTKWDVLNKRLSLTGSLYQIEMSNVREVNPADPTSDILAGDYRVRGFQIAATGHLTSRWEIFAGYSYNDAIVVSSPNPSEVGHIPPNAPHQTLSAFTSYKFPWHDIEVGTGISYVSSRNASSTPVAGTTTIENAPGYYTLQLMAKYPITPQLSVQANVTNVTNTYYYDQLHPGHIILGPSRAALLTLNVKL